MILTFIVGIIIVIDMVLCDILIACRIFRCKSVKQSIILVIEHACIEIVYILIYCDVENELDDLPIRVYDIYTSIPMVVFLIISLAFLAASAIGINKEYVIRKTTITPSSINQAFNNLNCALLYADSEGTPILVNRKMDTLSFAIIGERVWDANIFWDKITTFEKNDKAEKLHEVIDPVIKMADGSIWNFDRNEIKDGKRIIVEIIARDMKELYIHREELAKENEKLEAIQNELKVTYRNIAEIQQQEELLIYKMRVHDKLGNAILTADNSIKDDELTGEERARAINIWKDTISDLKKNAYRGEVVGEGSIDDVVNTAQSLGAKYIIEGSMPAKNPLLAPALREAMYNAIRHSGATVIHALGIQEEEGYRVIISDNGKCNVDKIVERGGLATMRRKIERSGGTMSLVIKESLEITLFFPKVNRLNMGVKDV